MYVRGKASLVASGSWLVFFGRSDICSMHHLGMYYMHHSIPTTYEVYMP